ncbi:MAG: GntR family transcriptional regulator [bacterium]|nr:GntR family transcriptional regulator [bacterium]
MEVPLKQKAYEYVLLKIMSGALPPGTKISEVAMAKEIGISPTPLREAYRQLAGEGLLKYVPNAGVFVREINRTEIEELYETREAIEAFCAGKASLKMNAITTAELKECLDEMLAVAREFSQSGQPEFSPEQQIGYLKADARFHLLILRAAGNGIMLKTMRECHILGRLLNFKSHRHTLQQVAKTIRQHYRIYTAIRDRDYDRAVARMKSHIEFSRATALENSIGKPDKSDAEHLSGMILSFIHNMEKE